MPEHKIVIFTQDITLAQALAAEILIPNHFQTAILTKVTSVGAVAALEEACLLFVDSRAEALLDLFEQLAARDIVIPKILVCPPDQQLARLDYFRFGISDYLYYPFQAEDVLVVVERNRAVEGNGHTPVNGLRLPVEPPQAAAVRGCTPQHLAPATAENDPVLPDDSQSASLLQAAAGLLGDPAGIAPADGVDHPGRLPAAQPDVEIELAQRDVSLELMNATEHHLELILEHISDGTCLLDANGRILIVNSAAARLLGQPPHQLVGRNFIDIWPANASDDSGYRHMNHLFEEALCAMASMSFDEGIYLELPSGRSITIEGTAIPIVETGQSTGVAFIFREVSVHRDVMQLKGELISMASHNLRTPLTTVLHSLDYMLNTQPLQDKGRIVLERARAQTQKMSSFLRELLEISNLALGQTVRLKPEPTDLYQLLPRVARSFELANPDEVALSLELPEGLPLVLTDDGKLEIILKHILAHSAQRCLPNGLIDIKVKVKSFQLIIQIIDSGPTLAKAQLEKIFWPLYPLEDDTGSIPFGYAVGLYTIRQLVRHMGGEIWISQPAKVGTCLSLALPIWRPTEEAS